jgi:prolipoprotein diacylglyceryltransferase
MREVFKKLGEWLYHVALAVLISGVIGPLFGKEDLCEWKLGLATVIVIVIVFFRIIFNLLRREKMSSYEIGVLWMGGLAVLIGVVAAVIGYIWDKKRAKQN